MAVVRPLAGPALLARWPWSETGTMLLGSCSALVRCLLAMVVVSLACLAVNQGEAVDLDLERVVVRWKLLMLQLIVGPRLERAPLETAMSCWHFGSDYLGDVSSEAY